MKAMDPLGVALVQLAESMRVRPRGGQELSVSLHAGRWSGDAPALQERPFQAQKRLFAVQAAAVADELPVGTYHPVAREHDRQRIPVHHGADGPGGARTRSA